MKTDDLIMLDLFIQAKESPHGIAIEHNNPVRYSTYLRMFKRDKPEFDDIAVCQSPSKPATEIWLVKGYVNPAMAPKKVELDL